MTLIERIFARCMTVPFSGCWIWMGALTGDGYGSIKVAGKVCYTHHLTHDEVKGAPRKGQERDHKCKIRSCCNPDHLEAVSASENAARGDWHKFCAVMPSKDYTPDRELTGDPFALA